MTRFRLFILVQSFALVSCDPFQARAAPAAHTRAGVGVGAPLVSPLGGVGLGTMGLGFGSVWLEPRLSRDLALVAVVSGDYQRARVAGESVSSLWCAPGLGLRWFFGAGRVRPSGYVLLSGSYARQHGGGIRTSRLGAGAETGVSLDAALSEVVDLRLSVAFASVAHSDEPGGGSAVTAARVGIAPFVGTAVAF